MSDNILNETFEHEGETYEIRKVTDWESARVAVFLNNKKVSCTYSSTFEVTEDLLHVTGMNSLDILTQTAKDDVIHNRLQYQK